MIESTKVHKEKMKLSDKFPQPFVSSKADTKTIISKMNHMQSRIRSKKKK
jgi:hypothetical protein